MIFPYSVLRIVSADVGGHLCPGEAVYVAEGESFSGKFTDIREVYEGKNIVVVEFHGKQWYLIINKGAMGAELMEKIREYRRGNDKYNKK